MLLIADSGHVARAFYATFSKGDDYESRWYGTEVMAAGPNTIAKLEQMFREASRRRGDLSSDAYREITRVAADRVVFSEELGEAEVLNFLAAMGSSGDDTWLPVDVKD